MLFHVLGPVEFHGQDGAVVAIGAEKPRTLLSLLALHANSWVDTEQIVGTLWGDSPSATARNNVKTYVWRLRRQLPGYPGGRPRIEGRPGAYRLNIDPDELDAALFEHAVSRGRKHLSAGNPPAAMAQLEEALRLWRGEPFDGLATPDAGVERARLAEVRWQAREGLADAMLAIGQTTEAIGLLRSLIGACPLRERIWYRLIVALRLADRRADALDAYQQARRTLIEELGVEPGPELRKIHKRILREDTDEPARRRDPVPLPRRATRNFLPPDLPDFVGRARDWDRLRSLVRTDRGALSAARLIVIDGPAGVGKTAFALHAAHLLAGDYPDAQLYVDLRGHCRDRSAVEPAEALRTLLGAIGAPGAIDGAPTEVLAAQWRAWLADQRAIVVIDDVADAEQLRPLLLAGPGCLVLATSRRRLVGPDGARSLTLDVLSEPDSATLLARAVGDGRADDEPEATAKLAELCGHLPLALRIAATRLAHRPLWTFGRIADHLERDPDGLDELCTEGRSVAATLESSYVELLEEQRRTYRLLALAPTVDVDAHEAAALVDRGLAEVEATLEHLVDAHLLLQASPGRYRLSDLHRRHACSAALAEDSNRDRRAALTRLLDFYLRAATVVTARLRAGDAAPAAVGSDGAALPVLDGYDAMREWLAIERANLITAVAHAEANGLRGHARRLRDALPDFLPPKESVDERTPARGSAKVRSLLRRPAVALAALAVIAGFGPVLATPDDRDVAAHSGVLPSSEATAAPPTSPDAVVGGDKPTPPAPAEPPIVTPDTGQPAPELPAATPQQRGKKKPAKSKPDTPAKKRARAEPAAPVVPPKPAPVERVGTVEEAAIRAAYEAFQKAQHGGMTRAAMEETMRAITVAAGVEPSAVELSAKDLRALISRRR